MALAATTTTTTSVTTRSRTLLFFSYRDSAARPRFSRSRPRSHPLHHYGPTEAAADSEHDDDERQGLIPASSSSHAPQDPARHVALDLLLPPKWVDISEQVEDIIAGVQSKIAALDRLHAKHVLPGFTDRSAEEREIETAASDITRASTKPRSPASDCAANRTDFRQCHTLIQRITSEHAFPPTSKHASLAAQNVQRALAAKVQELSGTFRKKQRVYMEKLQGHAIKNQDFLVASGAVSLKGSEGMTALEEDVQASQQISPGHDLQSALVEEEHAPLHERSRELNEIAKSIAALAELFKDLSALVIDQGTILDSVEYNVEQTAVNVEEAVKELNVATTYQKNTGRRSCIFLLVLVILGLILVLIFKPRRHTVSLPAAEQQQRRAPRLEVRSSYELRDEEGSAIPKRHR